MAGLSDARQRIVKRLSIIEAEADVLRKQLALLDEALALEEQRPPEQTGRKRPANPPRDEVVQVVVAAAKAAKRPISRQEALEAVTTAGMTIAGAKPIEVLATMLWRERAKVAKLKDGYWPAGTKPPKG